MIARTRRPDLAVGPGERLLAWAHGEDGSLVGGTRDALYLQGPGEAEAQRIPWETVQAATWDRETGLLRVSEVGTWGAARPERTLALGDPRRLLMLVRERVTATVVLQRHVPVSGRRGVHVIARRAPGGERAVTWVYEFDEGVDPDDPDVRRLAAQTLLAAREEVGLT